MMVDYPRRYDIEKDEMVPVTQADWDSAMKHVIRQREELKVLRTPLNGSIEQCLAELSAWSRLPEIKV